jgi:hypothetical protein
LVQRGKFNLDIFWLKDESLEDSESLPGLDEIAVDVVEDLRAELEQLEKIVRDLPVAVQVQLTNPAPITLGEVYQNMAFLTAYLDTCIVSGLAKEDLKTDEFEALRRILEERKQGNVSLVTSRVAQEEIERIPEDYRSKHEIIYNLLSDVPVAKAFRTDPGLSLMGVGLGVRLHPMLAKLNTLLPDEADARHLYQAARNSVQYFLTTDARTILAHSEQIEDICQVKAVSPQEFVKIMSNAV